MDKFWAKVGKTQGCWLWKGSRDRDGYGYFYLNGKNRKAHRVSWEQANGSPGILHVLHKCDNPPCVNPEHLFLGTNLDNIKDALSKGRLRKKICRRGHQRIKENLYSVKKDMGHACSV